MTKNAKLTKDINLTEPFIRQFKDKVDWEYISYTQTLSEDFIREFKDRVDWEMISVHQKLSEDFIREFKDKVDWEYICIYQVLSDEFIKEFKDESFIRRPSLIYTRDIKPYIGKHDNRTIYNRIAEKYLSIWKEDEEITWNEFISKYPDKHDIVCFYDKIFCKRSSGYEYHYRIRR